jgi:hypothetical protein
LRNEIGMSITDSPFRAPGVLAAERCAGRQANNRSPTCSVNHRRCRASRAVGEDVALTSNAIGSYFGPLGDDDLIAAPISVLWSV